MPMMMDFGDYELLEEIGRGGQGVVFRARQKSLNRTVALKVIALGHWATETHLKRFRREAEAAASLEHPSIVPIYEIGERDGTCYFSMKFEEGGQLDQLVRRQPLSLRRAAEIVASLARTVHYAHERGILHRDIKPGNILVDAEGEPHLTDFGLARLVETESTVTRTMEVLGTPSYIAPEQAAGQSAQLTSATDAYGLGAVFYQLLTGHPPFAGGTTYETIRLVLETEPRNPRLWNSKVDRDLATICLKCLEKNPERRYPSALALAEDLERWLRHEPIRARRTGIFTRSRKWIQRNPTLAALLPLSAALLAAIGMLWWNREPEPPPAGIAVLPFANLGGDKEDAAFVDGMQDDILTKLARVADLKVTSRTSVMQYRGARDTRKIAQALHVSHVLEGSVRKSGDRIRLNAQLIDGRTDEHVWAQQYDRSVTDVFAIQTELAQDIVSQLSARISLAEEATIKRKPTQDLQAYDFYLHARKLIYDLEAPGCFDPGQARQAIGLLEKAVARDPHFWLTYCLLARVHLLLYWNDPEAHRSLNEQDRDVAAERARAEAALSAAERLAPDAGETHLTRARFYYEGDGDYLHALEQAEIAGRSQPNNADLFRLTAEVERRLQRWSESMRHFSRAIELDPRDWRLRGDALFTYFILGRAAEAKQIATLNMSELPEAAEAFRDMRGWAELAQGDVKLARADAYPQDLDLRLRIAMAERNYPELERLLVTGSRDKSLDAQYSWALGEAVAARGEGDPGKARAAFLAARPAVEEQLRARPADAAALKFLSVADAVLGRKEDALREGRRAVELQPLSRDPLLGTDYLRNLAFVYTWVGEPDRAIAQLSALAGKPNGPSYGELKQSPLWEDLRDDPRFGKILTAAATPIALP